MGFIAPAPWRDITRALRTAKRATAVTAFLGRDASRLIPLKSGDRLVVDASLSTVRAGLTNPTEISRLLGLGVKCYSVSALHAKVYVADDRVFIGSANASKHSDNMLIEACLEVRSAHLADRVLAWIDSLPLEPIDRTRLRVLKREYRPPKWTQGGPRRSRAHETRSSATSWLVYVGREGETDIHDAVASEAAKASTRDPNRLQVISHPLGSAPRFYHDARPGDEVYVVSGLDRNRVFGPSRVVATPTIRKVKGWREAFIAIEDSESYVTLSELRQAARKGGTVVPESGRSTRRLRDAAAAILRGLFRKRKRQR